MSNFIHMEGTYLDISSIAYLDVLTRTVILKGGYVVPNTTFTGKELHEMARVINKCNIVFHEESLLFLHPVFVQEEINKFCQFMAYPEDFKPEYKKPNDTIYKILTGGDNDFVGWVQYLDAHDSLTALLEQVEIAYKWWEARNAQGESDEGKEGEDGQA